MKTPDDIISLYETYVKHSDVPIFLSESVKAAMKEYAKQWVEQVVKEMSDSPHGNDSMLNYYHLVIDAQ